MLILQTPAKINPVLEVLNRRPDGYHELALVFQAIALYDQLGLEKRNKGIEIIVENAPKLAGDDSNLAVKAAKLYLRDVLKDAVGVKIVLRKKIPIAAGLGGGSSDAAATLRGLQWLFEEPVSEERMNDMAAQLGSDVNFFLNGGTALGTGRGETITPWASSLSIPVLLIKPPQGLSTSNVYQSGKALMTSGDKARNFKNLLANGNTAQMAENLFNGLEPAAFYLRPEIELIKKRLVRAGVLGALLSGSGPTIFALTDNKEKAQSVGEMFKREGYEVLVTQTISTGVQRL